MGGACSTYDDNRRRYRALVGERQRKRALGRPRCRWEDDIKIGLQELDCGGMDWIDLT